MSWKVNKTNHLLFCQRFALPATILDLGTGRPSRDRACSVDAILREVSTSSAMKKASVLASLELRGRSL